MALRRNKRTSDDQPVPAPVEVEGVRHAGPWDSTERTPDEDGTYLDLGSLLVRVRPGLDVQLPTDGAEGEIGAVMLVAESSALELRAFAATRSGGLWDEVRDDLILEVARLDGECEQVDGPFGAELHVKVPAELPDGEQGFQPSRIVGIEGPRWLLRATFLGDAALNPSDDDVLMQTLRDVIVQRGPEPRIPRESLLLTLPPNATLVADDE
ncbi:DUF3710 domain-containing protein [Aeromicrobium wangtongii]|uniref:DUF3710 domain-containing protein n=1 Tax=Aeromicrobium wangtongii TaxID=2969247 RepID=A0ABY5MEM1_9ACTN|nr:DUF3710 domain-containing protein [Aeromicrobium wangtongii]MCD9197663.1 DUF3710 domain-containing protein [Aeromicrobium wangtongii]UUP15148.1 DUF3710 domain-containing protein [Aeromicrobium wangtongii]